VCTDLIFGATTQVKKRLRDVSALFTRARRCAQGSLVASTGSIALHRILIFTTNRGICFRSKSNSGGFNRSGSATVLAQLKSRGATQAPIVYQSNQLLN
jgi:hypothetical protein